MKPIETTLSAEDLIDTVEEGLPFGRHHISQGLVRGLVEKIKKTNSALTADSPHCLFLKRILASVAAYFDKSTVTGLFTECELYLLEHDICLAQSRIINGRKIIVISAGMMQLILVYMQFSRFPQYFPKELLKAKIYEQNGGEVDAVFEQYCFAMLCQFYKFGQKLPNFATFAEEKVDLRREYAIALAFIVFHEFGHLSLGHLDGENRSFVSTGGDLAFTEEISLYKQMEFDADRFVYDSMSAPLKLGFPRAMDHALGFFFFFETTHGIVAEGHPVSINRFHHAKSYMDIGTYDKTLEFFKAHGQGLDLSVFPTFDLVKNKIGSIFEQAKKSGDDFRLSYETGRKNDYVVNVTRENIIKHFQENLEPHFRKHGIDLSAIYR